MVRLFVAIELPDSVQERLRSICHGVPGARWTRDGQFHLTLSFLGEVEGPTFREVREGLNGVRADPFELTVRGAGHFPPRGAPKVLWAGVEPADEVRRLHEAVDRRLRRLGQPGESRKFSPHVTLARFRGVPLPPVMRFLREHADFAAEPFPVTDFHLFSSVLGRGGPTHRREASYPLFARRPG